MRGEIRILEGIRKKLSMKVLIQDFLPTRHEKYLLLAIGGTIIAFIISLIVRSSYLLAQLLLILISLEGLVLILLSIYKPFIEMLNPTKALLEPSYKRIELHQKIIKDLLNENINDLRSARAHLEYEIDGADFRAKLLMGSVTSLGVLPAVFLLYASYYVKVKDIMSNEIAPWFMLFFVAMYMATVLLKITAKRLKTMIYLIDQAERLLIEISD